MEEQRPRTFKLHYEGRRFHDRHIPVDVLLDLPAYRDLLVSYVKEYWREQNPDRKRLPRNFMRGLQFDLVDIEEGSAAPLLQWDSGKAQLELPEMTTELDSLLEQAAGQVAALFASSESSQATRAISRQEERALGWLGSRLLEDERIELPGHTDSQGNVVYLDAVRRRRLLARGRGTHEKYFSSTGTLIGTNINSDQQQGYIRVLTEEYGEIHIPVSVERALDDFDGEMQNLVQFRLIIEVDHQSKFKGVFTVREIDVVDKDTTRAVDDARQRISALASLTDGWYDGKGIAPASAAIDAGQRLLKRVPDIAKSSRIFPTVTGGLMIEFAHAGWDYTLEIDAKATTEFYGVEIDGEGETEVQRFTLDNEEIDAALDQATRRQP